MSKGENEELITYRFEKAKDTLNEADVQIENQLWNVAVNRLYYACFYAVSALLASKEIYSKTHAGAKQMFSLHFVTTGIIKRELSEFYGSLFSLRQSGDYEDFCDYERDDVIALVNPAKELIETIEFILYKNTNERLVNIP